MHRFSIYRNKQFLLNSAVGLLFLIAAMALLSISIQYVNGIDSRPVKDLILSSIPAINVSFLFLYGPVIFWIGTIIYIFFFVPRAIPFTAKTIGLFVLVRSLAITLTPMAPFPTRIPLDVHGFFATLNYGSDFFFSGHTGLPFLLALIFWHIKPARIVFLCASAFFGIVVLLGHWHYSIDVFGAFFVTYTIFHMARWFFSREQRLLLTAPAES